MKTRPLSLIAASCILALAVTTGVGAEFRNLNFEEATVVSTGELLFEVDRKLAFPGWNVGPGGVTMYNNSLFIMGAVQVLMGPVLTAPSHRLEPLEGSYSALLAYGTGNTAPDYEHAALGQRGTIPASAKYLTFRVDTNRFAGAVTIDDVAIPLFRTSAGRVAGDISAYAGREVYLRFMNTNRAGSSFYFDDVQFTAAELAPPGLTGKSVWAEYCYPDAASILWDDGFLVGPGVEAEAITQNPVLNIDF